MEEQHLQKENKNANFSLAEKESRVESPPSPNSKSLDADLKLYAHALLYALTFMYALVL